MANINPDNRSLNIEFLAYNLSIARKARGKTVKECSNILGIPTSRLKNYEAGKYIPSLPEIEALSFVYRIPVLAFFQEDAVRKLIHTPENNQLQKLIEIRQRIISTRIHLARENAEISLKQLSQITSIPTSRIKRYEKGTTPIALDDLKKITKALNLTLDSLFDHKSPLGNWQDTQSENLAFEYLPEEIKEFIVDSDNLRYLYTAQDLSKIGIERLDNLSNSLAELTDELLNPKNN